MSAPARFGRYRVERRIGSGAFATVWLARDEVLDAPVAVKVLADNWTHRLDVRQRFEEEARILRRADSDRVVRVHDIGELEDGRPYFVMTYADGGTLADRLLDGPLPVAEALRYGTDIARGLAVVHQVGVIHRDVNPRNVLLRSGRDGVGERVLIADLGLAKAAAQGSGFTLTVGSPGYMAPEQARPGETPLDRRADVYAVGAVVHHMLSGVAPDPDRPPAPLRTLRPEVPEPVAAVVAQALATRPEDRFPSAGALADALEEAALKAQEAWSPAREVPARPAGGTPAGQGAVATSGMATSGTATSGTATSGTATSGTAESGTAASEAGPLSPAEREDRLVTAAERRLADRPPDADDTLTLALPRPRRRRGRLVAVLLGVLVLLAGVTTVAVAVVRSRAHVAVSSADGTLRLSVPRSWAGQLQRSSWDLTRYGGTKEGGTALRVAPDVAAAGERDSDVPGVFAGRTTEVQPAVLLARSAVVSCTAGPTRSLSGSGLTGTVVRRVCAGSSMAWVEAVLQPPDKSFTVYVQVKGPASGDSAEQVVASLSVRSP